MSAGWPETETRQVVVEERHLVVWRGIAVWRGMVVRVTVRDREHCRGMFAKMEAIV